MCNWNIGSGSLLSAKLKHKEEGRELRGTWCCVMELVLWSTCFGRGNKHVLMPAGIRAIARRFSMTVSVGTYIVPGVMKNLEDCCIQCGGISQGTEEQRESKSESQCSHQALLVPRLLSSASGAFFTSSLMISCRFHSKL